jgi:hypothetical protein
MIWVRVRRKKKLFNIQSACTLIIADTEPQKKKSRLKRSNLSKLQQLSTSSWRITVDIVITIRKWRALCKSGRFSDRYHVCSRVGRGGCSRVGRRRMR